MKKHLIPTWALAAVSLAGVTGLGLLGPGDPASATEVPQCDRGLVAATWDGAGGFTAHTMNGGPDCGIWLTSYTGADRQLYAGDYSHHQVAREWAWAHVTSTPQTFGVALPGCDNVQVDAYLGDLRLDLPNGDLGAAWIAGGVIERPGLECHPVTPEEPPVVVPPVEEPPVVVPPVEPPVETPETPETPTEPPVVVPPVEEPPVVVPPVDEPETPTTPETPEEEPSLPTPPAEPTEPGTPSPTEPSTPTPSEPAEQPSAPSGSTTPISIEPSIVLNDASPVLAASTPEQPAASSDTSLAYTGTADQAPYIVGGLGLLLAGVLALVAARLHRRSPRYRRTGE